MSEAQIVGHGDIWDNFNSYSYIGQNFLRFLPEDRVMLEAMMDGLETLGAEPYAEDVVADIGNGGTFEYSSVLQRLVRPTGAVQYMEYSPHGLWVARQTLEHHRRTGDAGEWQKYGDAAIEHNPSYAVGPAGEPVHPTTRSFTLGQAVQGNVYELPPKVFGAAGAFYVAESISPEATGWNNATEHIVGSVRLGGIVMVTAMRLSEGYTTPDPNGNIVFPAYPVDTDDVAGRLEELGVRDIQTAEAFDEKHGMRPVDGPQYQGVCLAMGIRAVEVTKPTIIV